MEPVLGGNTAFPAVRGPARRNCDRLCRDIVAVGEGGGRLYGYRDAVGMT